MDQQKLIARLIEESEARLESIGKYKDPSEFAKPKKAKGACSICKGEIHGNVDPSKILTCCHCIFKLLLVSKDLKIQAMEIFLERGDLDAARSVESFIVKEEGTDIATLKTTMLSRHSNRGSGRFKPGFKQVSK